MIEWIFFGAFAGIFAPITLLITTLLERRKELRRDRLEFKYEDIDEQIQPNECHRFEFAYQAGRWFGYRPKPDTHIISCKVDFTDLDDNHSNMPSVEDKKNTRQESTDIEISIFPSLSGMIFGTLIGSLLGTFSSSTYNMFDLSNIWHNFSIIIVNLILGFIAGIVLMRRKDVQSFITIEDLWGGIY